SRTNWNMDHVRQDLRQSWGAEYDANMNHVAAAVKRGGERLEAFLDDTGAGNNPAIIRTLAALGRDPNFLNPATAQSKIDRVMNDPTHKYWKGDKQSVFEMSL